MMLLTIFVSGLLAGGPAAGSLPLRQSEETSKPVLPGDPGYVVKRARELVALARCRDAVGRTDLLLEQSRERLREREALGSGPRSPEDEAVARGLASSYRNLTLSGAPGTLECGIAEGRDLGDARGRYLEETRRGHERWVKVLSTAPPEERSDSASVLRVSEEAPARADAAQAAGLDFLKKERARRDAAPPPPAGSPEPPPSTPPGPSIASPRTAPEPQKPKPPGEPSKSESDLPRRDTGESAHPSEHHSHSHRPHH